LLRNSEKNVFGSVTVFQCCYIDVRLTPSGRQSGVKEIRLQQLQ